MAADASSPKRRRTVAASSASQNAPLALYRRYRPATFAELKGQDHVTEPLRQALRSGRVHHAYLFSGPRGCGKTSSARILARSLNCEAGPTPDPCGKCASCVALAPSGPGSIDVIEIDAASHGGVDDARDLRERAFYSPVAGRYKIYIIDEAHMVTGQGFNALLKLVEEPPPHLKFVFATTEPEKVIPTIKSRTHHYPFRLVPPAILRELLEEILAAEKVKYEPAVLPVVIRAGAGSVRDTLSVLDQLMAGADEDGLRYDRAISLLGYTDDALLDEMADAFAAGDGALVFGAIDHVVEAGHDPRRFAMDLLDRLRDLIVLAAVPDAGTSGLLDVPEDRLDRMREQAKRFGQDRLVGAAETISNGLVEMRGATSPRLLLELMCAQVLLPANAQQPADPEIDSGLDARIERLERDLASAMDRLAAVSPERLEPRLSVSSRASAGTEPSRAEPRRAEPARAEPARAEPATQPIRGQGSGPDATTLREHWTDVLDSIRNVSKVAWTLLNNATVDSVEGNVLTLAFSQVGYAKGFGSSGCDQSLAQVLDRMFGVRPVIKTVVQPTAGPGGTADTGRAEASTPDVAPESDRQDATAAAAARGADDVQAGHTASRSANPRAQARKARPADPEVSDDPRLHTDQSEPGHGDDLSGTDLIMRELGGHVIEEIGED
jgi:DNA polymerase III subunit gamma/tau